MEAHPALPNSLPRRLLLDRRLPGGDGHLFVVRFDYMDASHPVRLSDVLERWVHSPHVPFSASDAFAFGALYVQPYMMGAPDDNDGDGSQTG
jgi:hypothetical protein